MVDRFEVFNLLLQFQSSSKFMTLQIDDLHESSIYKGLQVQNSFFTHY